MQINKNISEIMFPLNSFEQNKTFLDKDQEMYRMKEIVVKHLKDKFNCDSSKIMVSELFYLCMETSLLNLSIEDNILIQIKKYLQKIVNPEGGVFPSITEKQWQQKSRIYSTFYFLSTLELLSGKEAFLKNNKKWLKQTREWLISLQKKDGANKGAFIESDCPMSVSPENSYWAMWCLYFLNIDEPEGFENQLVFDWVLKIFLNNKKLWSITRLFYAINILRIAKKLGELSKDTIEDIKGFVQLMNSSEGCNEYPSSVKEGYREEKTRYHKCFHSTLYSKLIFKILGSHFSKNEVMTAIERFRTTEGYGTKVKIKEYEYGPSSTLFENMLMVVTLFCAD